MDAQFYNVLPSLPSPRHVPSGSIVHDGESTAGVLPRPSSASSCELESPSRVRTMQSLASPIPCPSSPLTGSSCEFRLPSPCPSSPLTTPRQSLPWQHSMSSSSLSCPDIPSDPDTCIPKSATESPPSPTALPAIRGSEDGTAAVSGESSLDFAEEEHRPHRPRRWSKKRIAKWGARLSCLSVFLFLSIVTVYNTLASEPNHTYDPELLAPPAAPEVRANYSSVAMPVVDLFLQNEVLRDSAPSATLLDPSAQLLTIMHAGPAIFTEYKRLIAKAQHEVLFSFYHFYPCRDGEFITQGAHLLGEGLIEAARRLPAGRTLSVRIIASQPAFGTWWLVKEFMTGPVAYRVQHMIDEWYAMGLDPAKVDVRIGLWYHYFFGNEHSKVLIVDAAYGAITGANIQWQNNPDLEAWDDLGASFVGKPVRNLLDHFDDAWGRNIVPWACDSLPGRLCADEGAYRCRRADDLRGGPFDRPWRAEAGGVDQGRPIPTIALPAEARDTIWFNLRDDSPMSRARLLVMENTKHHMTILTPNINDFTFIDQVIAALERGVTVKLVTVYRMNSKVLRGFRGFALQAGGDNSYTLQHVLLPRLKARNASQSARDLFKNLHVAWYSQGGPDVPLDKKTLGVCHSKLFTADSQVTILGSGNQNLFTWKTSREFDLLFDDRNFTEELHRTYIDEIWANAVKIENLEAVPGGSFDFNAWYFEVPFFLGLSLGLGACCLCCCVKCCGCRLRCPGRCRLCLLRCRCCRKRGKRNLEDADDDLIDRRPRRSSSVRKDYMCEAPEGDAPFCSPTPLLPTKGGSGGCVAPHPTPMVCQP